MERRGDERKRDREREMDIKIVCKKGKD